MTSIYSLIIVRSKNAETNAPEKSSVGKMRLPSVFAFVPQTTWSHQLIVNLQPTGLAKINVPAGQLSP